MGLLKPTILIILYYFTNDFASEREISCKRGAVTYLATYNYSALRAAYYTIESKTICVFRLSGFAK
jgi:hypothetical protein